MGSPRASLTFCLSALCMPLQRLLPQYRGPSVAVCIPQSAASVSPCLQDSTQGSSQKWVEWGGGESASVVHKGQTGLLSQLSVKGSSLREMTTALIFITFPLSLKLPCTYCLQLALPPIGVWSTEPPPSLRTHWDAHPRKCTENA